MEDLKALRGEIEKIDKQMATLFEQRMQCAGKIADYKSENGMPILDEGREQKLIKKNEAYINEELFKPFYRQFMYSMLDISINN